MFNGDAGFKVAGSGGKSYAIVTSHIRYMQHIMWWHCACCDVYKMSGANCDKKLRKYRDKDMKRTCMRAAVPEGGPDQQSQ